MPSPTLLDAIRLAVNADYIKPLDKGGQPYVLHVLRVMLAVQGDDARTVAVLHDLIEDTPTTLDDLRQLGYPEPILEALDAVTKRDGESYEDFIERAAANPLARVVKLADLEDNLDVTRLRELTEKDGRRINKYLRARQRLRSLIAEADAKVDVTGDPAKSS